MKFSDFSSTPASWQLSAILRKSDLITSLCVKFIAYWINLLYSYNISVIMAQVSMTVRMDASLKSSFDALCSQFGMSANTAMNVFARAVVQRGKIPFWDTWGQDGGYLWWPEGFQRTSCYGGVRSVPWDDSLLDCAGSEWKIRWCLR